MKVRYDPLSQLLLTDEEYFKQSTARIPRPIKVSRYVILLVTIVTTLLGYILLTLPSQIAKLNTSRQSLLLCQKGPGKFKKPKGFEGLHCDWVLDGHNEYVRNLSRHRVNFEDPDNFDDLPMDCGSIGKRHYWTSEPSTELEGGYPIAQARVVFKDYLFVEFMLASTYQPQNWYCYMVDVKADHLFRARMKKLAACLPNVIITGQYENVDSAGHSMDQAHLDCLRLLAQNGRKWEYVHLLQNHDVPARTNYELVYILKNEFHGANDIQVSPDPNRINYRLNWTMEALDVFHNRSRLQQMINTFYPNISQVPRLTFAKGLNEVTVSRAAIDYIFHELNLTHIVQNMDQKKTYGVDELLFPTILSFEPFRIPGGFTQECLSYITRFTSWHGSECHSRHYRHGICIMGVEDLGPQVNKAPNFFINKIMPEFDFGAVVCWMEVLYNRTWVDKPTAARLDLSKYRNLAHVRFQALKDENGLVSRNKLKNFECELN